MGFVGGSLGYRVLKVIAPSLPTAMDGSAFEGRSKLRTLLGDDTVARTQGAVVLDFGCGTGEEVVELAKAGAARVIGLDLQEHFLERGRGLAESQGVADRTEFVTAWDEPVDIVVTLDAFEHFGDVDRALGEMYRLLRPGGHVSACFGPTWFHPLGGHLFSVFPWAHLIFTEKALIRWRDDFKDDGATRFSEVAGGLNQMTIRRFEAHIERSPFVLERLEPVPIRGLKRLASRLTREFTTAVVRATLRKPSIVPGGMLVPGRKGAEGRDLVV